MSSAAQSRVERMMARGKFGKCKDLSNVGVTVVGPKIDVCWGKDDDEEKDIIIEKQNMYNLKKGLEITFELATSMKYDWKTVVCPFYEMICIGHSPEIAASIVGFEIPTKKWCKTSTTCDSQPRKKELAIKMTGLPTDVTKFEIGDIIRKYSPKRATAIRIANSYDEKIAYILFETEKDTQAMFDLISKHRIIIENSIIQMVLV